MVIRVLAKKRREIRRRMFVRRARRQKRHWFSAALRERAGEKYGTRGKWKRAAGKMISVFFWGIFAVLVLMISRVLIRQTGNREISYEKSSEFFLEDKGWSKEFFGIEFRVRDGRIILFHEKKEMLKEEKEEETHGDDP